MIKTITLSVSIEPEHLCKNIRNHILDKIRKKLIGTSTYDCGFISSVSNIVLVDNKIPPSMLLIIYTVRCDVECNKIPVNGRASGRVAMLFPTHIFLNVGDRLQILVPVEDMKGYRYKGGSFVPITVRSGKLVRARASPTGPVVPPISLGSTVSVIITMRRYENSTFKYIGRLTSESDTSENKSSSRSEQGSERDDVSVLTDPDESDLSDAISDDDDGDEGGENKLPDYDSDESAEECDVVSECESAGWETPSDW